MNMTPAMLKVLVAYIDVLGEIVTGLDCSDPKTKESALSMWVALQEVADSLSVKLVEADQGDAGA